MMFSRPFCRDQFFGTRGKVADFDFWLYFSNNTSIIYKKWTTSSEYDDKQMYGTKTHKFQEMKKVEILFSYNCCWLSSGLAKKVVPSKCTWPWEHFKKILCHRFLITTLEALKKYTATLWFYNTSEKTKLYLCESFTEKQHVLTLRKNVIILTKVIIIFITLSWICKIMFNCNH